MSLSDPNLIDNLNPDDPVDGGGGGGGDGGSAITDVVNNPSGVVNATSGQYDGAAAAVSEVRAHRMPAMGGSANNHGR